MSVMSHGVDIQCDGCLRWVNIQCKLASKARRSLRLQGWVIRNERTGAASDYCPACKENHPPMHKRINHV